MDLRGRGGRTKFPFSHPSRYSIRNALESFRSSDSPVKTRCDPCPLKGVASNGEESMVVSERMQVMLTVRSLTGIVSRQRKMKSLGRSLSPLRRRQEDRSKPLAPMTAVVSANRDFVSSGFAIQTYLPSAPLVQQVTNKSSDNTRSTAYWQGDDESSNRCLRNQDGTTSANMQLTRIMKREMYRPGVKINRVPHFVHERIDLTIWVSRGKEIIPLGVASIAVSGDEEQEVVVNVAVKPREISSRRYCQPGESRKHRAVFRRDPLTVYSLEENATLTVGIRCVADQLLQQTNAHPNDKNNRDEGETPWLQVVHDNSLLLESQSSYVTERDIEKQSVGLFCNAMFFCSDKRGTRPVCSSLSGSRSTTEVLTILSDVSDKTFGSSSDSADDEEMSSIFEE